MERRLAAIDALGRVRKRRSATRLRVMQRKLLGALFALVGLMLWAGPAAATPAGTVIMVSGSCTDHDRVLNRGDVVQIGDTLEVPAAGNLKLQMADGSMISSSAGSGSEPASSRRQPLA